MQFNINHIGQSMITVDFCVTFTQLLPQPIRSKPDQQMFDLVQSGKLIPDANVFDQFTISCLFGNVQDLRFKNLDSFVESSYSPVAIYFKVYSFMMANQDAFVQRLQ